MNLGETVNLAFGFRNFFGTGPHLSGQTLAGRLQTLTANIESLCTLPRPIRNTRQVFVSLLSNSGLNPTILQSLTHVIDKAQTTGLIARQSGT